MPKGEFQVIRRIITLVGLLGKGKVKQPRFLASKKYQV